MGNLAALVRMGASWTRDNERRPVDGIGGGCYKIRSLFSAR